MTKGNTKIILLSSVAEAQELVTELSKHNGLFTLTHVTPGREITVDAKSILGVVTIVSQSPLYLTAPLDFDFENVSSFIVI